MNFVAYLLLFIDWSKAKKPYGKQLQAAWRIECELGIVTDPECPVDGGWSPWGPWSVCHGTCDDVGHQTRTRDCINPPPSQDGLPCQGLDEQIEPCYIRDCTVDDYRKLIEGDAVRTDALRQLEAMPSLMERCLQIECPYEAIEADLEADNTWQLNSEVLWNALQCVKHDIGCPLAGGWGDWGAWSACGARCGKGLRWQLRKCDSPPPSVSHLVCSGSPLRRQECEGDQCAIDVRFIEQETSETWSQWSNWTDCSENCGTGIKRRKRSCVEKQTPPAALPWGTHCRGPYDQLDICNNEKCVLDGGMSGWSMWGPCSQTCGAGKRSRTRSCTRPIPSGGGHNCVGPKVEVGSCHLSPCEVFTHIVASFNGDSFLQYTFSRKRSTFFHFYIRFMSLSPRGTLVRRGSMQNPTVRLSLHKWHACLDAGGESKTCRLPRVCSPLAIEPATWHSILLTVTSNAAIIRIDDAQVPLRAYFPCNPEFKNDAMDLIVGDRFHGEVQEIIVNFIPLNMFINHGRKRSNSDFSPISVSNMAYEKGNIEEAFLILENGQYLRIPCFKNLREWNLDVTLKSKRNDGTILTLSGENGSWFIVLLQNMRLKIKVVLDEFKSEISSSTEILPGQWLDISLSKKRNTNAIETVINAGERLHVLLPDTMTKTLRTERNILPQRTFSPGRLFKNFCPKLKHSEKKVSKECNQTKENPIKLLCKREFFIGGLPLDMKNKIAEDLTPFAGIIAALKINNVLYDLQEYTIERDKDGKVQVSSRSASISGSYHETAWGESKKLNLTCLHARTRKSPNNAHWLFLDTVFDGILHKKIVRSIDDGRVLRLVVTNDDDLRGFYTCCSFINNRKRNIVTYGVLGEVQYALTGPDLTTIIAVFTTLSLVIFTIGWLAVEGYYDIRDGYGFFRDMHLTPEEVKTNYDNFNQNVNINSSEIATKDIKARISHEDSCFINQANSITQECRIMDTLKEVSGLLEDTSSEPEELPPVPMLTNTDIEPSHQIYRCEPSYVSSPRHGSNITSPRTKLTSSSSVDTSPRVLCSRLLMSRYKYSSRESLSIRSKKTNRNAVSSFKNKSNLLTIKSSTFMNITPAQKILQKFKELKEDDP